MNSLPFLSQLNITIFFHLQWILILLVLIFTPVLVLFHPVLALWCWCKRLVKLCPPAKGSIYVSFLQLDFQPRWDLREYQRHISKDRKLGFISHKKATMQSVQYSSFYNQGTKRGDQSQSIHLHLSLDKALENFGLAQLLLLFITF